MFSPSLLQKRSLLVRTTIVCISSAFVMGLWSSKPSTPTSTSTMTGRVMYQPSNVPLVYSDTYNIGFWKLENLHPFDSKKYGKIYQSLIDKRLIIPSSIYTPIMATEEQLLKVHTSEYLQSLSSSMNVARIVEVPPVAMLPISAVRSHLLEPMRYAVGGTLLAAELAARAHKKQHTEDEKHTIHPILMESDETKTSDVKTPGWAINLAGGYHHACGNQGGGFCVYADITLAILHVAELTGFQKFMIIDLDAHQGNGHANDKLDGRFGNLDVFILDMYNSGIYPQDHRAARAIDCPVRLRHGTGDDEYLSLLQKHLDASMDKFKPEFVVYNAGTDCLAGDPLGNLNVSARGIAQRDAIVFQGCLTRHVPMVMLLSGGYQKSNAAVISGSIENLHQQFGLLAASAQTQERRSTTSKEKVKKRDSTTSQSEPEPKSQL